MPQDDLATLDAALREYREQAPPRAPVGAVARPGPPAGQEEFSALDVALGRKRAPVGFLEAAGTTATGRPKGLLDWIPYISTGIAGADWAMLFDAALDYEKGRATPDQEAALERFMDWHARERGFRGRVGELAGDLPVFAGEFATGLGVATVIGKKAMQTVGGKALARVVAKMMATRMGALAERNVVTRTVAGLAKAGMAGTAVGIVNELPRAPWGRVMANARRLQFQRRFSLTENEAGELVILAGSNPGEAGLLDVLPTAIVDELIEYGSEMTGGAIPFVAKLDALHDDLISFLIGKRGIDEARKLLKKGGIEGIWAEIGEEYLGAGVREAIGQLGGPEEFKGQLPETFRQTAEMYVAFGLRGGAGRAGGILGDAARDVIHQKRVKAAREELTERYRAMYREAGQEVDEEAIAARVEKDVAELKAAPTLVEADEERREGAPPPELTREELLELESMTPEEAEEVLRAKGFVETEEEPPTPSPTETPESGEEVPETEAVTEVEQEPPPEATGEREAPPEREPARAEPEGEARPTWKPYRGPGEEFAAIREAVQEILPGGSRAKWEGEPLTDEELEAIADQVDLFEADEEVTPESIRERLDEQAAQVETLLEWTYEERERAAKGRQEAERQAERAAVTVEEIRDRVALLSAEEIAPKWKAAELRELFERLTGRSPTTAEAKNKKTLAEAIAQAAQRVEAEVAERPAPSAAKPTEEAPEEPSPEFTEEELDEDPSMEAYGEETPPPPRPKSIPEWEAAYAEKPAAFGTWLRRFWEVAARAHREEKHDLPAKEVGRQLKEYGEDWEAFSRARGYTEQEIANFRRFLELAREGEKWLTRDQVAEIDLTIQQSVERRRRAATEAAEDDTGLEYTGEPDETGLEDQEPQVGDVIRFRRGSLTVEGRILEEWRQGSSWGWKVAAKGWGVVSIDPRQILEVVTPAAEAPKGELPKVPTKEFVWGYTRRPASSVDEILPDDVSGQADTWAEAKTAILRAMRQHAAQDDFVAAVEKQTAPSTMTVTVPGGHRYWIRPSRYYKPPAPKPAPKVEPPEDIEALAEQVMGGAATEAQALYADEAIGGDDAEIELEGGRTLAAVYSLAEYDWITPSHDPRHGFRPREGGDPNERPYQDPTEGKELREKVRSYAAKPKPRLLLSDTPSPTDGPPIVNSWGVVLGGNARAMTMELVYAGGGEKAEALRNAVRRAGPKFGFTREQVAQFTNPVIVREVAPGQEGEPGELSRVLNVPLTAGRTQKADAISRGRQLKPDDFEVIVGQLREDETLAAMLKRPRAAATVLSTLRRAGAMSDADAQNLLDEGELTPKGRAEIEQILLGALVTDVRALASLKPGHRNKIIAALPSLARIKQRWKVLSEHLVEAADALHSLRASHKDLETALQQSTIEDESWKRNPIAIMLAGALQELGPRKFAAKVREVADALEFGVDPETGHARRKPPELFETALAPEPTAAMEDAFKKWRLDPPSTGGGTLLASPEMTAAEMRGARAARARRRGGGGRAGSPAAPATAKGKPKRPKKPKPPEHVPPTEYEALSKTDPRVRRTADVLARFGIRGVDDPVAMARTMHEARQAAAGVGEVDLQGRDNLFAIIEDLARRIGLGRPGQGKARILSRWAAGFYDSAPEAIRLRKSSYVSTYVHEVGHHLHKVLFPRRGLRKDPATGKMTRPSKPYELSPKDFPSHWWPDLELHGKALYGDRKPEVGYGSEGFAEAIRFLIVDPAHLRATTPRLYRDLTSRLIRHHPETWLVIKEARHRFRAFLLGSQRNPVAPMIARGQHRRAAGRSARDRVTMELFDRRVRVRTMLEDLGLMDALPFDKNPYWMMRRVEGHSSGDMKLMIERGTWNPADPAKERTGPSLHEILDPVVPMLERFEEYGVARRTLEKRAQCRHCGQPAEAATHAGGKKGHKFEGFDVLPADPRVDTTSNEALEALISRIALEHPEIPRAWKRFQKFNRWVIRDYAVHFGLVTPEQAEWIIDKNQEYITFRYDETHDALASAARAGGGAQRTFVNLGSGIRRFTNSQGDPLMPPVPAYVATLQGIVQRAHHNAAARALLELAKDPELNAGTARWFQKIDRPMKAMKVEGEQLSQEVLRQIGARETVGGWMLPGELSGMDEEAITTLLEMIDNLDGATFWKPSDELDEKRKVVRVLVDGRPEFYQVTQDEMLWATLRGFYNPTQLVGFWKMFTLPSHLLRAGATQNNPGFGFFNVIRDVWMALTLTTTSLRNPRQIPDRWRGIVEAFMGGKYADLYLASGADMEGVFGQQYWNPKKRTLDLAVNFEEAGILRRASREALAEGKVLKAVWEGRILKNVRRAVTEPGLRKKAGAAGKAIGEATLLPLFGRLNSRLERMTRLGEFIVRLHEAEAEGMERGEAIAVAGHAAANITLDWTKGGRVSKTANQFIPFLNAAMLGPARIAEHFTGAWKKDGAAGLARAFARVSSFMLVPSVIQFLMVWDDEDYWNIDQERRDRHWYFPTGRNDHGAKTYLRLPKPYGLAVWSILAERSFAHLFGIDPQTGEQTGDPEAFAKLRSVFMRELAPTFSIAGLQPVIEVMAGAQGYDWYWDQEIVPMRDQDLPVHMQGAERSSHFARWMGRALGYAPAKIDHLIYGFTAGAGRDMVRTVGDPIVEFLAPWTSDYGEPLKREDLPIIRRFLDQEGRGRTEAIQRFYEDWEDVDGAHRGLNRWRQIHGSDDPRVRAYEDRHAYDLDRYTEMGRTSRQLAKLWNELRTVYRDVTDPDELEEEILRVNRAILEVARSPYQK